jgi:hypothetical protein
MDIRYEWIYSIFRGDHVVGGQKQPTLSIEYKRPEGKMVDRHVADS